MAFNLAESYENVEAKLDKFYVVFISAMHIAAISAFFCFSWTRLGVAFVLYALSGIGITVGYHRLLAHRSFKTPRWVEYVFATLAGLALEGGPITWIAQHRQHHTQSDTELDPHNIHDGFFYAHIWWIFWRFPKWFEDGQRQGFAPDLQKDAYFRWLEKYHYVVPFAVAAILFAVGGLPLFLWGFCLRVVTMWHSTWFVNSAAHKWGYRPFGGEIATNNWWVAILSLGEGWHNNHHAFPTSARHGLRKWEVDFSWIVIWSMKKLRLATKVRVPAPAELPWKRDKKLPALSLAEQAQKAAASHARVVQ